MASLRLYKKEKLCSATAIEQLFSRDAANFTVSAYPVRVFWRVRQDKRDTTPIRFLISVPKKRLRHAVDRVKMRRRIRESYRIMHQDYPLPEGIQVDVAFVYVSSDLHTYASILRAMHKMLTAIIGHDYECNAQLD